jgi:anti-anti-sigma factor
MSANYHVNASGANGVVTIKGRIMSDDGMSTCFDEVAVASAKGTKHWVCDASELEYCNSTGLNFFVRMLTRSRNNGGDCALVGLQPNVAKLFQLSKLNEIFTSYATLEEAQANAK